MEHSRRGFTALLVLALFVLPALASPASAQGSPLPAVELDCGPDPVMDVHPNSYEDAVLQCTVTNPTSASEVVEVNKVEWDGINVEMTLSEDEFTLAAGTLYRRFESACEWALRAFGAVMHRPAD